MRRQTDAELAETLRTGGDAMDADTLTSLLKRETSRDSPR